MVVVPWATPVTTPPEVTVAIDGAVDDQAPPVEVLVIVIDVETQRVELAGEFTEGLAFTVTLRVVATPQPLE